MQFDRENYLITTDIYSSTEGDTRFAAIPLGKLPASVRFLDNDICMVVLDVCRNNPFANPFRLLNLALPESMLPLLLGAINGLR